jgi:sugar/nucleoside kinase (ribokinase family)
VLITAIGGGPWSAPVRDEMSQLGIDLIDLAANTLYETPLTTVIVNKSRATRTIVNPPQPQLRLDRPAIWNPAWGDAPGLVLTDGFHLDEVLPLLRSCQAAGAQICLDGGSWKQGTEELASILSVAICGERFSVPGKPSDPEATIKWFAEKGAAHIAVTRGSKPILAWDRGRRFEVEIAKIDAADTTGAGDVLHGAFCYHFSQSGDFEHALRLAAEIATRSCEALGIRGWLGNR